MVNVAEIFSVPLKTLEDIDKLTKGIELGKYEVVWSRMTSEKSKAVMDAIFAMWYAFVAANPSGTCASSLVNSSSLRNMAKDTSNLIDTMHIDESPIFISVSIQEKPSSYVGAVGGSKPKPIFSEDGLSIIASQIGKPIMLDSYTSSMCIESWGRSSFARCLIEINADDVLK
ncbi:hypothetical protein Tco_1488488 [Tanacetum coccineum]